MPLPIAMTCINAALTSEPHMHVDAKALVRARCAFNRLTAHRDDTLLLPLVSDLADDCDATELSAALLRLAPIQAIDDLFTLDARWSRPIAELVWRLSQEEGSDNGTQRQEPPPKKERPSRPERRREVAMVEAKLRVAAFLWDDPPTLKGNPFKGDGTRSVPDRWPGDDFKRCRIWHGIDIRFPQPGVDGLIDPAGVVVEGKEYVGWSGFCGIYGRAVKTHDLDPTPVYGSDENGPYVEAYSILGARVGMYLPEFDAGAPFNPQHDGFLGLGEAIGALVEHVVEEFAEQFAEDEFTGTDDDVPAIYNYVRLRVWASGAREAEFVSNKAGNGFATVGEIINDKIGYSHIPEHHLYLDDEHTDSRGASSPGTRPQATDWIDTYTPAETMGFFGVNAGLAIWCAGASDEDKRELLDKFKANAPQFYGGSALDGDSPPWEE